MEEEEEEEEEAEEEEEEGEEEEGKYGNNNRKTKEEKKRKKVLKNTVFRDVKLCRMYKGVSTKVVASIFRLYSITSHMSPPSGRCILQIRRLC